MLLKEMFSPVGGPKEDDQDIDWLDDLKFYIDNDDRILNNYLFPAIRKHEKHIGHPEVYKIYLTMIKHCLDNYCKTYKIDDVEEKFSQDDLVNLAKAIAKEQEEHIKNDDYKNQ